MRIKILILAAMGILCGALLISMDNSGRVTSGVVENSNTSIPAISGSGSIINPLSPANKDDGKSASSIPGISVALDYVKRDMMAIRRSNDGASCMNPNQKFNVDFPASGGFIISKPSDREEMSGSWKIGLVPVAWGTESMMNPVGDVTRSEISGKNNVMPARIENCFSSGLSEWIVNKDEGIEHGFTIKSAPEGIDAGCGKILVSLKAINGAVAVSPDSVGVKAEDGAQVVKYDKLLAFDANNKNLSARFVAGADNTSLGIEVDISGAIFPVVIDPLATSASWSFAGTAGGDQLGYSVSTAGDVNGDGYSDVIIGAYGALGSAGKTVGTVYVFHGSATGLKSTPDWTADGELLGDEFGYSVSTAGDVNKDGYSDIIIGARGASSSKGKVYVFHGSSTGVIGVPGGVVGTVNGPGWIVIGENIDDKMGWAVSTAGDVNKDGYSDIIIGATGASTTGKVYVFHGSASGISGTAALPAWSVTGESGQLGYSVSTAGDVNGDGYSDVIVGGYDYGGGNGKVYVFHGSVSGISGTAASPAWSATGLTAGEQFGISVSTAGDVNSDGYSDIIVGAHISPQSKVLCVKFPLETPCSR